MCTYICEVVDHIWYQGQSKIITRTKFCTSNNLKPRVGESHLHYVGITFLEGKESKGKEGEGGKGKGDGCVFLPNLSNVERICFT